ncbi:hypothetical protein DMENIID0001_086400 [Sergentomyia squamirostris]
MAQDKEDAERASLAESDRLRGDHQTYVHSNFILINSPESPARLVIGVRAAIRPDCPVNGLCIFFFFAPRAHEYFLLRLLALAANSTH